MAVRIHPPKAIYALLFVLGLACSAFAGFAMAEGKYHSWIHILGFVLIMGASVFLIVNMEYPRMGIIGLDAYDQMLVQLRESMK
jgi:hypothetical protein